MKFLQKLLMAILPVTLSLSATYQCGPDLAPLFTPFSFDESETEMMSKSKTNKVAVNKPTDHQAQAIKKLDNACNTGLIGGWLYCAHKVYSFGVDLENVRNELNDVRNELSNLRNVFNENWQPKKLAPVVSWDARLSKYTKHGYRFFFGVTGLNLGVAGYHMYKWNNQLRNK